MQRRNMKEGKEKGKRKGIGGGREVGGKWNGIGGEYKEVGGEGKWEEKGDTRKWKWMGNGEGYKEVEG